MTALYHYGECPACEFSVVTEGVPPPLARNCGMCAADSGRDVWMKFRTATDDDKPEGYDARRALKEDAQ
jgi:hypothetical protein